MSCRPGSLPIISIRGSSVVWNHLPIFPSEQQIYFGQGSGYDTEIQSKLSLLLIWQIKLQGPGLPLWRSWLQSSWWSSFCGTPHRMKGSRWNALVHSVFQLGHAYNAMYRDINTGPSALLAPPCPWNCFFIFPQSSSVLRLGITANLSSRWRSVCLLTI